jgi:hypothetical protein
MRTERASRKSTPFMRALLGASWFVVAVEAVVDLAVISKARQCYTIAAGLPGIYVSLQPATAARDGAIIFGDQEFKPLGGA